MPSIGNLALRRYTEQLPRGYDCEIPDTDIDLLPTVFQYLRKLDGKSNKTVDAFMEALLASPASIVLISALTDQEKLWDFYYAVCKFIDAADMTKLGSYFSRSQNTWLLSRIIWHVWLPEHISLLRVAADNCDVVSVGELLQVHNLHIRFKSLNNFETAADMIRLCLALPENYVIFRIDSSVTPSAPCDEDLPAFFGLIAKLCTEEIIDNQPEENAHSAVFALEETFVISRQAHLKAQLLLCFSRMRENHAYFENLSKMIYEIKETTKRQTVALQEHFSSNPWLLHSALDHVRMAKQRESEKNLLGMYLAAMEKYDLYTACQRSWPKMIWGAYCAQALALVQARLPIYIVFDIMEHVMYFAGITMSENVRLDLITRIKGSVLRSALAREARESRVKIE